MSTKQKASDWHTLKRVVQLSFPFKRLLFLSVILGILVAVITPLRPYFIQLTVDETIIRQEGKGLEMMGLILLILLIVEFVVKYLFGLYSTTLGQTIMLDLRTRLFAHVQSMRLQYFDKTQVGIITTRTINDIEAINNIFSEGLITIVADVLTLIFVVGFLCVYKYLSILQFSFFFFINNKYLNKFPNGLYSRDVRKIYNSKHS